MVRPSARGSSAAATGSTIAENCGLSPTEADALSPYPRRDILLDAGPAFRRDRALVGVAFLQPRPIRSHIRAKILGEPDITGQAQRVTVDDIGRGEPARAQVLPIRRGCLYGTQPTEEPFGVIAGHLRVAPLLRFKLAVSQHQRLRKGQRRIAE